jgi:hypothetical protein
MNEKYTTSDLYLASFLKLKGHKISISKNKNKVSFEFDKDDELEGLITQYLTETASCDPLLYTNSIKNLKNLLYNL